MTTPPLRAGLVPAFHQLGDDTFEDLCREVLQADEAVQSADRYGKRGQRQFGVDLLIERTDQSLWVAQCKSHQVCTESLIKKACNDFLIHTDRWLKNGVTTLLLIFGADTRQRQFHDARLRERKRFKRRRLRLVVWSGAVLTRKLRHLPSIVRHFMPYHVEYVCGPSRALDTVGLSTATVMDLVKQYGEGVEGEAADVRRLWREGRPHTALANLRKLRSRAPADAILRPATTDKLIHLEGRLLLATGRLSDAKKLADGTGAFDPSGGARLRAMVAQAEGRLTAAAKELEGDDDPDCRALRAALHIQSGNLDEATRLLSTLEGHADGHRLRAVVAFGRGEFLSARLDAEKSLALAPTWYWVRLTTAAIRYFAGVSPVVVPRGLPEWPAPVPVEFLRQNSDSVAARDKAAGEFHDLSHADLYHTAEELRCLQAWHVACLADQPNGRADATRIATGVLAKDPGNYRVVVWVVARELSVTLEESVRYLEARVDAHRGGPEEAFALVAVYSAKGRLDAARGVLDRDRLFSTEGARVAAAAWRARIEEKTGGRHRRTAGGQTRATRAVAELRAAKVAGKSVDRWQQYVTLAQLDKWEEIAADSEELVSVYQTPDAVRLASYARYHTGDSKGTLLMLKENESLFFDRQLPPDLQRLRGVAQRDSGAISDALRTVTTVFEASKSREAFMELARLYFQMGDLKALTVLARRHDGVDGLVGSDYLTLGSTLRGEEGELARALWRRAIGEGIPDELVGAAFTLGLGLGEDRRLRELSERLTLLGAKGEGGVNAVGLDEVLRWERERRGQAEDAWRCLTRGELPSHVFGSVAGVNLATVYHRWRLTSVTATGVGDTRPVYQRSGHRAVEREAAGGGSTGRLVADVTAILNAAHSGLLGAIEDAFRPIRISQHTIVALAGMQEGMLPAQPGRIAAKRRLIALVDKGDVRAVEMVCGTGGEGGREKVARDVAATLAYGQARGALVVDFCPVRSGDGRRDATGLSDEDAAALRDVLSVVDGLRRFGALTEAEHGRAKEAVGPRTERPVATELRRNDVLLCRGEVLLLLAEAGVLERAAGAFRLQVPAVELRRERTDLERSDEQEADARWVGKIVDRLRDGLERGRYEFLPVCRRSGAEGHEESGNDADVMGVLRDVLGNAEGRENEVLWIDDRCVNSYRHSDGRRIVDTVELLHNLEADGRIGREAVVETLTEMRATDSRFIALDWEELVAALRDAPVEEGRLVETRSLRVLRQYHARCLLEGKVLRAPVGEAPADEATEWHFLMNSGRAVLRALTELWLGDSGKGVGERAEWLLECLYTEDRGMYAVEQRRSPEADVYRAAVSYAAIVALALQFDDGREEGREKRRKYLDWVTGRLLRRRLQVDKEFQGPVSAR